MKHLQSFGSKFGKFFDPFLILGIFILFLIPVVTVVNLTPAKQSVNKAESVLGSTDTEHVNIIANSAPDQGLSVEKATQNSDQTYTLYVQNESHEAGTYKNALFTASNGTSDEKQIHITSYFESVPAGTTVSILLDGVRFIVLDGNGTTYPPTLYLTPGSTTTAEVEIQSEYSVNYTSGFSLVLNIE